MYKKYYYIPLCFCEILTSYFILHVLFMFNNYISCVVAFEVSQTVALVHSDLHDENTLLSLNYIASTIIELKNFVDKEDCAGNFVTTHCKGSGKLHRKVLLKH